MMYRYRHLTYFKMGSQEWYNCPSPHPCWHTGTHPNAQCPSPWGREMPTWCVSFSHSFLNPRWHAWLSFLCHCIHDPPVQLYHYLPLLCMIPFPLTTCVVLTSVLPPLTSDPWVITWSCLRRKQMRSKTELTYHDKIKSCIALDIMLKKLGITTIMTAINMICPYLFQCAHLTTPLYLNYANTSPNHPSKSSHTSCILKVFQCALFSTFLSHRVSTIVAHLLPCSLPNHAWFKLTPIVMSLQGCR